MTTDTFDRFDPREYLDYYYSRIDDENAGLLAFFAEAYEHVPRGAEILEFGGGPTIYQIISAARRAAAIDFSDYLPSNLDVVRDWKGGEPGAHDWRPFIARALEAEGDTATDSAIEERSRLIRHRLRHLMLCDARLRDPCGSAFRGRYAAVGVSFVPEGITDSKREWASCLTNILSLLISGGTILMAAITEADYWMSGSQMLPAVNLTVDDLEITLNSLGVSIDAITTIPSEIVDVNHPEFTGYKGMAFIRGTKG